MSKGLEELADFLQEIQAERQRNLMLKCLMVAFHRAGGEATFTAEDLNDSGLGGIEVEENAKAGTVTLRSATTEQAEAIQEAYNRPADTTIQ